MEQETTFPSAKPSPQAQSWGAVISIIIIVLMIILGAFYSWNKRTMTTQNAYGAAAIDAGEIPTDGSVIN